MSFGCGGGVTRVVVFCDEALESEKTHSFVMGRLYCLLPAWPTIMDRL